MSRTRLRLLAVLLVGLLQLAVPVQMIAGRERTLRQGTAWRFRTAPVDPVDVFRGNYLTLAFAATQAPVPRGLTVERGDRVFVPLSRDAEGFAQLGELRTSPPAAGDWLHVAVGWVAKDAAGARARLDLPFDRFYLDERLAPRADKAFLALGRRGGERPAWAVVRVHDGDAVLEDVLIDGVSVRALGPPDG